MNPSSPAFSGTLSLVASGGACSGTEDTTDFGVSGSPYAITYNGSAAAGTYATCLKASQTGVTAAYQQVSIVVNSTGGIACDYGPNYTGSIPAAAVAAGYTHCAANYDFTQTGSFTNNSHSYTWSNMASWLDCKGASNPLWSFGYGNCSHINVTTDGGTQILDMQWQTGDYGNPDTSTAIQTSGPNNPSDLTGALFTVPTGKYIEFEARVPSATQNNACTSHDCILAAIWSYAGGSTSNFEEWDFLELYSNSGIDGTTYHDWNGAATIIDAQGEPHDVSGYDPTTYHTYGQRIAVDSGGDLATCEYLDGSLLSAKNNGATYDCGTGTYSPVPLSRDFLIMLVGPQGNGPNYDANADLYIKRETVWECASYASGECNNSSTAVQGGGALTSGP